METIARNINILGAFCGKRDLMELTREQLRMVYGIEQADMMVLFGGSIFRIFEASVWPETGFSGM